MQLTISNCEDHTVGKILLEEPKLLAKLTSMESNSEVLAKMLREILAQGDLAIHLEATEHSYHDNRTIVLGLRQLPTDLDVESTLIMEICNAWCSIRNPSILPGQFDTPDAYGRAIEQNEWRAVKKHIRVHKDLLASKDSLQKSRFEQAFEDPNYGWDNFENYLAAQQKSGHTAQIQSHWAPKTS
jgi:hypothetical protein